MKKTVFLILLLIALKPCLFRDNPCSGQKGRRDYRDWRLPYGIILKKQVMQRIGRCGRERRAMYQGPEPHGAFLTTCVNDVALKSITPRRGSLLMGQ